MKKRIVAAVIGVAIFTMSLSSTVLAGHHGGCGGGYSIMRDVDGSFLSKDAFEKNLDSMIDQGYIRAQDREFFVDRYDYCSANGGYNGGYGGSGMRW